MVCVAHFRLQNSCLAEFTLPRPGLGLGEFFKKSTDTDKLSGKKKGISGYPDATKKNTGAKKAWQTTPKKKEEKKKDTPTGN